MVDLSSSFLVDENKVELKDGQIVVKLVDPTGTLTADQLGALPDVMRVCATIASRHLPGANANTTAFLISKATHAILLKHKLPRFDTFSVQITGKNQRITTREDYVIILLKEDFLTYVSYTASVFEVYDRNSKKFICGLEEVNSSADLRKMVKLLMPNERQRTSRYQLNEYLDLIPNSPSAAYVSNDLEKALIAANISGVKFVNYDKFEVVNAPTVAPDGPT
ncbi:hypothetical protein [Neolewinella antarctica]|uniref:Uncharacterized protein n=1 Tax=Neolewinella antarctica TaxID=442734 RepID=A0ABX0XEE8_9BACT|nr:hypothetical protein [Neolewinella antarctica]NJC27685.1 hypothetical protein [Neolewinella antarctica]